MKMNIRYWWKILTNEPRNSPTLKKTLSVQLCPSQNLHGETRASANRLSHEGYDGTVQLNFCMKLNTYFKKKKFGDAV